MSSLFSHGALLLSWLLGILFCLPKKVDDWLLEGLDAWNLRGKAKVVGNCAFRALLWHLWKERNARTFQDKSLHYDIFCNFVQNMAT